MKISQRLNQEYSIRPLTPHEAALGKQILELNLGYTPSDSVLIVADERMLQNEAAIWFESAKELGLPIDLIVISEMTRSGEEPPTELVTAAEQASIVILQTVFSLTHTAAGKAARLNNGRGASLPGADHELIMRALSIPYDSIRELGTTLKDLLQKTEQVTVTSIQGTNLTARVRQTGVINDSGFILPGETGNLPAGEVFYAPLLGSTNGTLVIDGSIADDILDAPITVTIQNGVATKIEGGTAAQRLWNKLNQFGEAGRIVAEIGIGTNPAASISQNLLEAEKAYGTVHVAFGNSSAIGGENNVPIHIDGLISEPTVLFDSEKILANRVFVFPS
jgi:aminopeptidase